MPFPLSYQQRQTLNSTNSKQGKIHPLKIRPKQ